jgi:hypothetical protein
MNGRHQKSAGWFEVDKEGLAKLLRRRGPAFILYELIQNAWDTQATQVRVELVAIPRTARAWLRVEDDDPHGFQTLAHGYVLFAESTKKANPNQRGRFNLGEKLVLAACDSARLASTTGTLYFEASKADVLSRRETGEKLERGSVFEGVVRMTRAELDEAIASVALLLPPIPTIVNDIHIGAAQPIHTFEVTLPTEIADDEGYLKRTARKTVIRVHEPKDGTSYIYEMGIPVVEIGFPWSLEVMQKIPLNAERDNVTPAYQKQLLTLAINEMHECLTPATVAMPLVQSTLASEQIAAGAINTILDKQYGKNRVVYDPSDREANAKAFAHDHAVIPGGAFTREQWANIRRAGATKPAGQVFPTPKPYGDGPLAKRVPPSQWTGGMAEVSRYVQGLAIELLGRPVDVVMEDEFTQYYNANYGNGTLTFNVPRLGRAWFSLTDNQEAIDALVIHEFGHDFEANHLSDKYHRALTRLGAKMVQLALNRPELFPGGASREGCGAGVETEGIS